MNRLKKHPFFKKIPFGLIFIIIIVIISLYLRIYHIDTKDIWLDEANTVLIAERSLSCIVSGLKLDSSPPLFYFILHYWMKLFGQTETALRVLSALFGILLVIVLFFVGGNLYKKEVGIYSALIAAILPIQVMYSQQVRMYSLLPVTSILSMYFLMRFIQEEKKKYLLGYSVATIACIYTHNYGFFLLPAQGLMFLCPPFKFRTWIAWLLSVGIVGLIYAIWLPVLLYQFKNGTHYAWIKFFWNKYGFWGSLLNTLKSFSPGGTQLPYVPLNELNWNPLLPVIFIAIILLFGVIQLIIKRQRISFWLLLYLLVPLVIAGIISIIRSPVYLAGRCDQLVFPAFCLCLAVSISSIKPKDLQYGVIIILMAVSFKTLSDYYSINLKHGDKEIASTIHRNLQPGDAILCTSKTRASLEYYLRRGDKAQINLFSYPREMADHMGNQDTESMLKDKGKLIKEAASLEKEIRLGGSRSGRCFLLYVQSPVNKFLWLHLKEKIPSNQMRMIGKFRQSLRNVPVNVLLIGFKGDDFVKSPPTALRFIFSRSDAPLNTLHS